MGRAVQLGVRLAPRVRERVRESKSGRVQEPSGPSITTARRIGRPYSRGSGGCSMAARCAAPPRGRGACGAAHGCVLASYRCTGSSGARHQPESGCRQKSGCRQESGCYASEGKCGRTGQKSGRVRESRPESGWARVGAVRPARGGAGAGGRGECRDSARGTAAARQVERVAPAGRLTRASGPALPDSPGHLLRGSCGMASRKIVQGPLAAGH
mmetsp:Transcript_40464/g.99983  ORF Transcript_40464/g.99983 Transcript_40464/m.99983 type:complete len:213 (+) Transcript_40464:132-770(+)